MMEGQRRARAISAMGEWPGEGRGGRYCLLLFSVLFLLSYFFHHALRLFSGFLRHVCLATIYIRVSG